MEKLVVEYAVPVVVSLVLCIGSWFLFLWEVIRGATNRSVRIAALEKMVASQQILLEALAMAEKSRAEFGAYEGEPK